MESRRYMLTALATTNNESQGSQQKSANPTAPPTNPTGLAASAGSAVVNPADLPG